MLTDSTGATVPYPDAQAGLLGTHLQPHICGDEVSAPTQDISLLPVKLRHAATYSTDIVFRPMALPLTAFSRSHAPPRLSASTG
ncbi:hypothetical protein PF005_g3005 [Phytophthora fragariae]|uniref:Uncharacterized protein n=1 Tax=Phytophthora fragariae TaxID=53985 RepID=A0A6A3Z7Q7_9STRA|nr:hypothetical protein PF006_g2164 [Phytophthora fragariae]KAE9231709.1 hypothetical protein PF005_g3005 [Phytophthora fragariae]